MSCKIYNVSSVNSVPPYFVSGYEEHLTEHMCVWKSTETQWKKIGEVPSLEVARIMVTQNQAHYCNGDLTYSLKTEPSDEHYCGFVKIESDEGIEYYDIYNESHTFKLRDLGTVLTDYDFSTAYAFENLRSSIWDVEKAFNQWRKSRQNYAIIFERQKFTKKNRQAQKRYAANFRNPDSSKPTKLNESTKS